MVLDINNAGALVGPGSSKEAAKMAKTKVEKMVVEIKKGCIVDGEKYYPGDVKEFERKVAVLLINQKQAEKTDRKPRMLDRVDGTDRLVRHQPKADEKDKSGSGKKE